MSTKEPGGYELDDLDLDPADDENAQSRDYQQRHPDAFATYLKRRLIVFAVAYVGYVCAYLVRNNFKLTSKILRDANGWDNIQIGLVLTAFTLTYGFAKFFMGMVVDRLSLRRVFAGALAISAVLCILLGFVHVFWVMFGLMLLLGTVQGALAPGSMAMIANWYPNKTRGSGIAIWNTSQNLGGAALPIIISGLLGVTGPSNVAFAFWVPGVVVLVFSFIAWKFGGDTPSTERLGSLSDIYGTAGEPQVKDTPDEPYWTTLRKHIFTSPVILTVALVNAILYFLRFGILNWMPIFLGDEMGFNETQYTMAFSVLEWVAIPGCFFFAWVAVKLPNRQSLVGALGLVLLAGLIWLYMGNHDYTVLLIVSGLMGTFIYGPQLIINILTLNVVPLRTAGVAVGFVGLFGYIVGEMAANLVMPILAEALDWTASFTLLSAFALLGAGLYLSLRKREEKIVKA